MELINRDASDKYKGFRYQKLRLAKKMLELIRINPRTNIIAIPEYRDDGFLVESEGKQILEQNKEYSSNFTLNSEEVRKSIVNFIDNYCELDKDPYLFFVFYTNVNYGHERKSKLLDRLNLKPLDKPVIEYLINNDLTEEVIEFVSMVITSTYQEEYNIVHEKIETYKGFYVEILEMKNEDWRSFLKRITFQFGQGNLEQLTEDLDKEIKLCDSYKTEHVNKEQQIRSFLLEKIDVRMTEKHVTQKIINFETIKNVFLEVSSKGEDIIIDELHMYWIKVHEELNDDMKYRNLRNKIEDVCDEFKPKTMKRYNREATTVRDEIKRYDTRQINGLRYRVYESMERFFDEEFIYKESYTYNELNSSIKKLKERVVKDLESLKKDFDYGVKNNLTVEKVVLLLIDECFYSFDEE
ncbi:LeoA/HP0731 family dynamin-like GTPase [Sutcliffiella horikoshii]|uniref:LeoA/HP0731 family dynamin-like GTPase n=1 Tax=Sutcliffiella horikoshii TaxID=79883 RepID=UPI003850852E